MKNYFEYPFNESVKERLIQYYENLDLNQHSENHQQKAELKLARIFRQLSLSGKSTVLDLGCSRGYISRHLANQVQKVIGIDISENIIKSNISETAVKNLEFHIYDGVNIPLPDNSIDVVFLIDVLEHAFDPDSLIQSIYTKLKNQGALVIEVPFTGWLSEAMVGDYHQGHLRYYDPNYLKSYLENNNFTVESVRTYNSVPFSSKLLRLPVLWKTFDFILNLIPTKLFPYFGEIIIVCHKKEKHD